MSQQDLNIKNDGNQSSSSSSSDIIEEKKSNSSSSSIDSDDENKNYLNQKRERSQSKNDEKYKRIEHENMKAKITSMINENDQNRIKYPSFDAPLVSLSLFNELQANIFQQDLIEKEYQKYKEKYENKRNNIFYNEHLNDEWFKEKYDPEIYPKWKNEINNQCKKLCLKFLENYNEIISKLKLELLPEDEYNSNVKIFIYSNDIKKLDFEERERDITKMTQEISLTKSEINITESPYYAFDPDKLTIYIHQIPRNISRWQLLDAAKKAPGLESISLSEPIKNQNYSRFCWLSFENEEKCNVACDILRDYSINNDYKIHPIKSKSNSNKKIRLTPPLFEERIEEDLKHSKKLIEIFDNDKGIDNNSIFNDEKNRDKSLQLDIQLLYLRRVHGFCFYCLKGFEDERNLATKCDNIHLRHYKKIGKRKENINNPELKKEIEFDKFFSDKIKDFLSNGPIPKPPKYIKEKNKDDNLELIQSREKYCQKMTVVKGKDRYECSICQKLFKGDNFVINHINNKHKKYIYESVDCRFFERIKKENYMNDYEKCIDKPKMISSMEEYLNSVSSGKRHYGNNDYERSKYYHNDSHRDYHEHKRRHYYKDYKDLDDPENRKNSNVNKNTISYDDL